MWLQFLDISEVYNRVWRDGLGEKLARKIGVRGRVLRWMNDFLSECEGCVLYRGTSYPARVCLYSTIQGTVLDSILYNFLTCEVLGDWCGTERLSFADDWNMIACGHSLNDRCSTVNRNLVVTDGVWDPQNHIIFSKPKCMVLLLLGRQIRFNLLSLFDRELSFTAHIDNVRAKTWSNLRFVCLFEKDNLGQTLDRTEKFTWDLSDQCWKRLALFGMKPQLPRDPTKFGDLHVSQ